MAVSPGSASRSTTRPPTGARISAKDSVVRDAIVGREAQVIRSTVEHSLLGDGMHVVDERLHGMIGAGAEIQRAP